LAAGDIDQGGAETDSETKKGGASPVWCPTRSTPVHGRLIIIWTQE